MTPPSVLAVILNWRQPATTIECVQAVRSMRPAPQILIIDNGSGDQSVNILQNEFSDISILALPKNLGFAGGCNMGLRQAIERGFDYALLLNNDAFPASDMLACLLSETAGDIGLLSPKILYESRPDQIWFAGGSQDRILLELRNSAQNKRDNPDWNGAWDVDYLWGTCLLVNLKAAEKVGLMDEQFFMYYEDLDWSIRFRQAGYRLRLAGKARLYHRVAVSTGGTDSPLHRYYLARSSILFFRRYASLGSPMVIFFFRLGHALKMVIRLLLIGSRQSVAAYLRGLQDGWQMSRVKAKSERAVE